MRRHLPPSSPDSRLPLSRRERGPGGEDLAADAERGTGGEAIAALLDAAAQRLATAGILNPRREASHLYGAVAGLSPAAVWLARPEPAEDALIGRFEAAVAERASGVPFAYVTGQATFRSLALRLDRRALIPRPETEGLVDLALARVAPGGGGLAADIGTGSGCLALSLSQEGRFERILAVDNAPDAVDLARDNVALIGPRIPVDVVCGDLLEPLGGRRWRLIVSNPPYLTEAEYDALDPSVRDYEPRAALVSGRDGLDATRRLLEGARTLLEPQGLLAIEIDERRAAEVLALAGAAGYTTEIREDLFGKPRYALAVPKEDA